MAEVERRSRGEGDDPWLALVQRVLGGDAGALRALLFALSPGMMRTVRAVLGTSDADLDDAMQEALLGVLHALPNFRGECGLQRFANRIAVRTALRVRRRHVRRAERTSELADMEQLARSADFAPAPDVQHLAARRQALLRDLLDTLPEVQAETLALRVVLGLTLEETASATGAPINTVRSRVRLAREALRARIEREPELRELFGGEP